MIEYHSLTIGEQLKVVGKAAPGFATLGMIVTVVKKTPWGVLVKNRFEETCEFILECGRERLEKIEN